MLSIEKKRLRGRNRILLLSKFFTTLQEAMSAVACDVTQECVVHASLASAEKWEVYRPSKRLCEAHCIVPLLWNGGI